MFNHKPSLVLIILCSFSILLTLQFNPTLQKSYFSMAPDSSLPYELLQIGNGAISHYFDNATQSSRYTFLNLASGDAYSVLELEKTAAACKAGTPIFNHLHYHTFTDNVVYFCAANSSLLFINQADFIVNDALPLNLNGNLRHAKLATETWQLGILAMDTPFSANPQSSILLRVYMPSKQVFFQFAFNQNLASGEAVVAYAFGSKNYVATNLWQNNILTTKIYSFTITGASTYQIAPLVNFTSPAKTITKLFAIGNYFIFNLDTTLYFLAINTLAVSRTVNIRAKELTEGISHPAVVFSTDGNSLYINTPTLSIVKLTMVSITIFTEELGFSLDMQVALAATSTSNDLMFTYDPSGVSFKILDLKTGSIIRTAVSGRADDLMLTNATYTIVKNNVFSIFNLNTNSLVKQVSIPSSKYYYNKDQHIVTFLNTSCQVNHLDLVSGELWTTLNLASSGACSSYISFARITENGNPEIIIPGTQSYLIISETYGQVTFNTNSASHENDIINVNFDDLSLYYYQADQSAIQISAALYTFDVQSQSFQLNNTNVINKYAEENHLFIVNENKILALGQETLTLINQLNTQWSNNYSNNFNLATSFESQNGDLFLLFSFLSTNDQYPINTTPLILNSSGAVVSGPIRETTVSGKVTGPRSFALYDKYPSNIEIVRFYNSDL